ncbi:CocE/NonD family hydrolase [Microbacterium sp. NPDC019599]|uniref:CocE/NonD family hydrolase n=1 Tax=Microbacterium sp. NPDC019599 TaxID=3154690 RepID=UPI0033F89D4E
MSEATKAVLPLWARWHARRAKLPKPAAWRKRSVRIPMRDGVTLGADIYEPTVPSKGVLLAVGPYGRGFIYTVGFAWAFVGQGYTVVFASTRGTADSEGELDPMRTDARDSHDIVAWLREQPWYPGRLATVGGSYLGFTQWALLADAPDDIAASIVVMGPHDFSRHTWGTGSFRTDLIGWSGGVGGPPESRNPFANLRVQSAFDKGAAAVINAVPSLPVAQEFFRGKRAWMIDRMSRSDLDDPYWAPMQLARALETISTPTLIVAGWQDIFLPQSLVQYARLRERGVDVALTVGAWVHADILLRGGTTIARESVQWLDAHLGGAPLARTAAVRAQLSDRKTWLEFPQWPPAYTTVATWHLHPGGRLDSGEPATDAAPASFTYDPADPTPTIGGNLIARGGYVDDSAYAQRSDVLIYHTSPLEGHLTVLGAPVVTLHHSTSLGDADLFVRVSDVDARGRSTAVCEAYCRVDSTAGVIEIVLNDTAHTFAAGHRIRLMVAGGSFPQFSRNPGTGENPLSAQTLLPNVHSVSHAGAASTLRMPIDSSAV